jgi:hypothetical protein
MFQLEVGTSQHHIIYGPPTDEVIEIWWRINIFNRDNGLMLKQACNMLQKAVPGEQKKSRNSHR